MFPLYIREGSCIEEREKDERGRKKKKNRQAQTVKDLKKTVLLYIVA